ncbi:hypothetical protein V5799_000061 [Amblyomma americanum]|uniref:Uncharacterized protein n=1 Tax=Amblyomma americanum TaxID=6943 RepID=A0AAQ4D447_AMBAM
MIPGQCCLIHKAVANVAATGASITCPLEESPPPPTWIWNAIKEDCDKSQRPNLGDTSELWNATAAVVATVAPCGHRHHQHVHAKLPSPSSRPSTGDATTQPLQEPMASQIKDSCRGDGTSPQRLRDTERVVLETPSLQLAASTASPTPAHPCQAAIYQSGPANIGELSYEPH